LSDVSSRLSVAAVGKAGRLTYGRIRQLIHQIPS
jgi:hypothetical protein